MIDVAPKLKARLGTAWINALAVVAVTAAIAGLRAIGVLPPDTASPVAPSILEAAVTVLTPD